MRIRSHSESHIVELEDRSQWQIFPGDMRLTLNWKPETELSLVQADDGIASHTLVGGGAKVRVIAPMNVGQPGRSATNSRTAEPCRS